MFSDLESEGAPWMRKPSLLFHGSPFSLTETTYGSSARRALSWRSWFVCEVVPTFHLSGLVAPGLIVQRVKLVTLSKVIEIGRYKNARKIVGTSYGPCSAS